MHKIVELRLEQIRMDARMYNAGTTHARTYTELKL